MAKFIQICDRCGKEFVNTHVRKLRYCSVGCYTPKAMPTYICTNLETKESCTVLAGNVKAAHEHGCTRWPGTSVEVVSAEEDTLRNLMRPAVRELRAWIDSAYYELSERSNRTAVMFCLDAIEATVTELRSKLNEVFDSRPCEAPAGT